MSQRCINAFAFDDKIYGNGVVVGDDDSILKTHADHFAEVDESGPSQARAVEQAVAEPGGMRSTSKKKAPAKKAAPKAPEPKGDDSEGKK